MAEKPKEKEQSIAIKAYLLLYNSLQVAGWSYLLYQVVNHYLHGRKLDELWETVKITVIIFQNAALLEIFNVALGYVKSNLAVTTMQVFSRVMVVCGVILATPTAKVSNGLPLLLIAWSVTEVIRYLFYALNIIGMVPYALIWCRYTFFYVLYPVGVTGELLTFYSAQSYVASHKQWSTEMPNNFNFTFSYSYVLLTIMLSYIPLFPKMFMHMVNQRKKIIGGQDKKKA